MFDSDVIRINLSRISVNTENITLFTVLKSCVKKLNPFSENCILTGSLQLVEFLSKVDAMVKMITNYRFVNFKVLMSSLGLLSKLPESLRDFYEAISVPSNGGVQNVSRFLLEVKYCGQNPCIGRLWLNVQIIALHVLWARY